MRTEVVLLNGEGKFIFKVEVDGGFDLKSAVQMAIGKAQFEMGEVVDINWRIASIHVRRDWK